MGCTTSKINDLPLVSLCHERCKFLEEALYKSYALANATVAYMESLEAVSCCLHQLYLGFHHNINSNLSTNSHSDFELFQEDQEEAINEIDYLNPMHMNHFNINYNQPSDGTGGGAFTWKTPSPPPASSSSTWDFLNVFEPFQIVDREVGEDTTYDRTGDNVKVEEVPPVLNVSSCEDQKMERMKVLFKKAADSGHEALRVLDVGKFRFHHNNYSIPNRFTKVLDKVVPSFLVLPSNTEESVSLIEEPDEQGSVDFASTLKKLCTWENKLCSEVKAEKKLCVIYARKCRQMKCLEEKGAKANELDSIKILLGVLSANIKVSIQVIERISVMINRLRDEELWPLMTEFLRKLIAMWKSIEEYHKSMSLAFAERRLVDAISSSDCSDDTDIELLIHLDTQLQNLNPNFSNWVSTQRDFVKALNGWFTKCLSLPSETELRTEVVPPFSPNGMSGTAAMFVFCTKWSLAADRVSEMEVIDATLRYSITINNLLEQKYVHLQQKQSLKKCEEKSTAILEKELERMQKLVEAQCKKKLLGGRNANGILLLHQKSNTDEMSKNLNARLVGDLKRILVTLERFSANIIHDYNEIYLELGLEI